MRGMKIAGLVIGIVAAAVALGFFVFTAYIPMEDIMKDSKGYVAGEDEVNLFAREDIHENVELADVRFGMSRKELEYALGTELESHRGFGADFVNTKEGNITYEFPQQGKYKDVVNGMNVEASDVKAFGVELGMERTVAVAILMDNGFTAHNTLEDTYVKGDIRLTFRTDAKKDQIYAYRIWLYDPATDDVRF